LHFFVSPKKPKEKKGDPTVCVPPLRYGQPVVLGPAGVELELASLRQSLALFRLDLRSSAHTEGFWGTGSDSGTDCSEADADVFVAGVKRKWLRIRLDVGADQHAVHDAKPKPHSACRDEQPSMRFGYFHLLRPSLGKQQY
jgi:hypothetical protein